MQSVFKGWFRHTELRDPSTISNKRSECDVKTIRSVACIKEVLQLMQRGAKSELFQVTNPSTSSGHSIVNLKQCGENQGVPLSVKPKKLYPISIYICGAIRLTTKLP